MKRREVSSEQQLVCTYVAGCRDSGTVLDTADRRAYSSPATGRPTAPPNLRIRRGHLISCMHCGMGEEMQRSARRQMRGVCSAYRQDWLVLAVGSGALAELILQVLLLLEYLNKVESNS